MLVYAIIVIVTIFTKKVEKYLTISYEKAVQNTNCLMSYEEWGNRILDLDDDN